MNSALHDYPEGSEPSGRVRILLIGDSLCLPSRPGEGEIQEEETYPNVLLQELEGRDIKFVDLITKGLRRRTIDTVVPELSSQIAECQPTHIIVHVGIVDCAPRVFSRRGQELVGNLRPSFLRSAILKFVHIFRRPIIKSFPLRVYTQPDDFLVHAQLIVKHILSMPSVRRGYFIAINEVPWRAEYRSPGFGVNVSHYNRLLRQACMEPKISIIDFNPFAEEFGGIEKLTIQDGIHLNSQGHRSLGSLIAATVARDLDSCIPSPQPNSI
jgi:hypothetical protein